MGQFLPCPLSGPFALYSPSKNWVLRVSLPYPGVPVLLTPAACTRTVGRAIFLGSLHPLPGTASGGNEEGEGKGLSPVLQEGMAAPALYRAKCEMWLTLPCQPRHLQVRKKLMSRSQYYFTVHTVMRCQIDRFCVKTSTQSEELKTSGVTAVFLSMCMSRAQPCEAVRLAV